MKWSGAIGLSFEKPITPEQRLALFFGHYASRIYLTERAYLELDVGSLLCTKTVTSVDPNASGLIGSIGAWCEINDTARIHSNGEHAHTSPVNINFTTLKIMNNRSIPGSMKPTTPFRIGSGVVVSSGVEIMAGADIGDGAVVGAGAIVTRPVQPFEIVGGVPAKSIGKRKPCLPWWNFSTRYICENFDRLNDLVNGDGPHQWREPRPAFVYKFKDGGYELLGVVDGGVVRPLSETPPSVRHYVAHALNEELPPYWVADCWVGASA